MKEYLKMSDVFNGDVLAENSAAYTLKSELDKLYRVHEVNDDTMMCSSDHVATYAAHAINSHDELVENMNHYKADSERWEGIAIKEASSLQDAMNRIADLEEFLYHFCDNSYNVDIGGGDYTATTCEAKDMAHKLDNRVWPDC